MNLKTPHLLGVAEWSYNNNNNNDASQAEVDGVVYFV